MQTHPKYIPAAHLNLLDRVLMQVSRYVESVGTKGLGHVIVEMPPRHGKSLSVSQLYPAWHLGRNPDHRIMLVSYGASLAEKHSRQARNYINSPKYRRVFPGVMLAKDSKSVEAWNLEARKGGMDALGITGGATGKGSHVLVCDDVVKSREEAESVTYREKIYDAFTDDLYSRREPGGAVIVMMTRWHEQDLIGKLLMDDPDKWVRVRIPAIAENWEDPLGRVPGEALWEERFPIDKLEEIRRTMGEYSFAALYQQAPVPADGGIFKKSWFTGKLVTDAPEIVKVWRFWDLAMSEKTSADYTVGVLLGMDAYNTFYVLDVKRVQKDWGDIVEYMKRVILNDGKSVLQGVEAKGYQSRAISDLNADPELRDYAIQGFAVDSDKLTRALPVAAKMASGVIRVAHRAWTEEYISELCSFPNGYKDDQVDATSGVWAMTGMSIDNVTLDIHRYA